MIRLLLLLTLVGCVRFPPPAPLPSASPSPGAQFCLTIAQPAPDASFLLAILNASEDWNAALGREVFAWQDGAPLRLVQYPSIVVGPESVIGGIFVTDIGVVILSSQTPEPKRRMVAAHELGHALGLSHSENPADLMFHSGNTTGAVTPNDVSRARLMGRYNLSSIRLTKVLGCLYN